MAEIKHYDVVINGGGVSGLTLALALSQLSLRVTIIEPRNLVSVADDTIDLRVRALNHSSVTIFKNLNVWSSLTSERLAYFKQVEVWNNSGEVHFDAKHISKDFLGVCVEEKVLLSALAEHVMANSSIDVYHDKAHSFKNFQHDAHLILESGQHLAAGLIVAADGAHSWLRSRVNIELDTVDYGQTAIVATVKTAKPHDYCARQRFLHSGPLVFLPLAETHTSSIVWSLQHNLAKEYLNAGDNTFRALLENAFQTRLGDVEHVSQRFSFPLMQRIAKTFAIQNVALVSDAAHTMHPLAGLGLNVGLMDVAWLVQIVQQGLAAHCHLGDSHLLAQYQRARRFQIEKMQKMMMAFKQLFSHEEATLSWLRNMGMKLTEQQQWLKNLMMLDACQLECLQPDLAK